MGFGARKDPTPYHDHCARDPANDLHALPDAHGSPSSLGQRAQGAKCNKTVPPRRPRPSPSRRLALARALSRPPARHRRPGPGRCQSRPACSWSSTPGPTRKRAPRAQPSWRQHPGKRRRRRRLPGPRPLGPRPGPAGSRLSGRAGPPPTDSQPDRSTGRKEGRKNRPTGTLPPRRSLVTVRSPDSAILLSRPPSSSSGEATLPNRRPPPAPPPLAPPSPARPSTHSGSCGPAPPLRRRPVTSWGRKTGGAVDTDAAQSERGTGASDATQSE